MKKTLEENDSIKDLGTQSRNSRMHMNNLEKGLELANSLDGIYACFIDEDYNVYYSDGMEDFIIKQ